MQINVDATTAYHELLISQQKTSSQEHQAAELFLASEKKLYTEDADEALLPAESALKLFRDVGNAVGVVDSVRNVARVLNYQGKNAIAQRMVAEQLEICKASSDENGQAKMLLCIAELECTGGEAQRLTQACRSAQQARETFRKLGDKKQEGMALLSLIALHFANETGGSRKQTSIAVLPIALEAVMLFKGIGDRKGAATALHGVMGARAYVDEVAGALRAGNEAAKLFRGAGLLKLEAMELTQIANWCVTFGMYGSGLTAGQKALEIYRDLGSGADWEASAIIPVCRSYCGLGKASEALQLAQDSLDKFGSSGNNRAVVMTLDMVIRARAHLGDFEKAIKAADDALMVLSSMHDEKNAQTMLQTLCWLQIQSGDIASATKTTDEIMAQFKDSQQTKTYAQALSSLADVHWSKYEDTECLRIYEDQCAVYEKLNDRAGQAASLFLISNVHFAMQSIPEAAEAASDGLLVLSAAGERRMEIDGCQILWQVQKAQNDIQGMAQTAERMQSLAKITRMVASEVVALLMMCQTYSLKASGILESSPLAAQKRGFVDMWNQALAPAKDAVQLARTAADKKLLPVALYNLGYTYLINRRYRDTLPAVEEAEKIFRELDELRCVACTLLLTGCAHLNAATSHRVDAANLAADQAALKLSNEAAARASASKQQAAVDAAQATHISSITSAREALNNSLEMFKQCGDEDGAAEASAILERIEIRKPVTPEMIQAAQITGQSMDQSAPKPAEMEVADPTAIDFTEIRRQIFSMTANVAGLSEDELEYDTPLMQKGLTSQSTVTLRNALMQQFQIQRVPFTVVFDFPSVSALAEHISEPMTYGLNIKR